MGKAEIHIVHVPRRVTRLLLILVSLVMIGAIVTLSGRAYYNEPVTPMRMLDAIANYNRTGAARANLLAALASVIANALLFVPWGALAFLAFDRPERGRSTTYAVVLAVGVTFALAVNVGQELLPTRVTGWVDTIWNAAGTLAGALLGHLRKSVRVRFV